MLNHLLSRKSFDTRYIEESDVFTFANQTIVVAIVSIGNKHHTTFRYKQLILQNSGISAV
jgi:hypothetical protein